MQVVIGTVVAIVTALFFTIPVWNERVFHSVNVSEVIAQGRDGLSSIIDNFNRANYPAVRDTARSLVQRFRNDSLTFFLVDIYDWDKALALVREGKDTFSTNVLLARLRPEDLDSFKNVQKGMELPLPLRMRFVNALNAMVAEPDFFVANCGFLPVERDKALKNRLQALIGAGILSTDCKLTRSLTPQAVKMIRAFQVEVVARLLYPQFLRKERNRNTDWASEFIVQTALYYYAQSFRIERRIEDAIKAYDSLLTMYPRALQAEKIFLEMGQILAEDGRSKLLSGELEQGAEQLRRAIGYLEKVEKNRTIARDFPKYKHVELHPGLYVNIDEAAKAKKKIKQKTELYTQQQAKAELGRRRTQEEGGNVLEDAVKLIGECYILLGKTDSGRTQFGLLAEFFPESDNLDDAQKLIADSYVKDGDRYMSENNTERVHRAYENAVKQYLKFINVYPQSELISQVYIALGDTYAKLGKSGDAARAFAAALDLAKEIADKAQVQLQIGNYYYERRQYREALKAYEVILSSFSSVEKVAATAQYLIGGCYEALNDTASAVAAYDRVVSYYKQSDPFPHCALRVGQWHMRNGNYKAAREYFTMGYSYRPDGPQAAQCLYEAAMVWVRLAEEARDEESRIRNHTEAAKQLSKLIEQFRDTPGQEGWVDKASYQLAQSYMKVGKEEAARKATKTIKNRALIVSAIKIIGIDIDDPKKEVEYWDRLYNDALDDEERAAILFDKAAVLLDKLNDHEGAMALYQKMLELTKDPGRKISASIGIGRVLVAQKKYAEAAQQFSTLLVNPRLSPELRQQLQVQLYDAHFNAKQYDVAREGFMAFAAQNPDHELAPYAVYRGGVALANQGKHQEALEQMLGLIERYAKSQYYDEAILAAAEQMIALGRLSEGVGFLEKFLSAGSLDRFDAVPNIYLRLGETYRNLVKDNAKAIQAFEAVVNRFPDSYLFSYAAYQLGMVLKDAQRETEAMEVFEKVPQESGAIFRAAQAEIGKIKAKSDPEAAVSNYEKIVMVSTTAEDSAIALIGIGDVYATVKKWDMAAKAFERVYHFYHGNDSNLIAGAIAKWVDALINDKKFDAAITAAQIMQEKYPTNQYTVNAIYFEATAWFAKKNYANARKKFLELIERGEPEQLVEIAFFQKADSYYFSERYADAVREYDEYLKRYANGTYRAAAIYMQGNAYWNLQQFEKAGERFRMVVSQYPDFPDVCNAKNFWAFSLDKTGKWREAVKLFNEVIASASCPAAAKEFARKQRENIHSQH